MSISSIWTQDSKTVKLLGFLPKCTFFNPNECPETLDQSTRACKLHEGHFSMKKSLFEIPERIGNTRKIALFLYYFRFLGTFNQFSRLQWNLHALSPSALNWSRKRIGTRISVTFSGRWSPPRKTIDNSICVRSVTLNR